MPSSVFMTTPKEHKMSKFSSFGSSGTHRTALSSGANMSLAYMANETKRKVKWDCILRGASPNGIKWKWLENTRHFAIYTKQYPESSNRYSVLSVGKVKASVHEVASLLVSTSQQDYEQKMVALHDKDFLYGEYVADISGQASLSEGDDMTPGTTSNLSVRSATFAHPRWFQRDDEWNFLETTKYDAESQRFEKLLTTLTPVDVKGTLLERTLKSNDAKRFRDIVAGYCVQPEETDATDKSAGPPTLRVNFYAELEAEGRPRGLKRWAQQEASVKTMKQRLLTIAKDCDRLNQLVSRRRLGVQVLVDERRVFLPMQVNCHSCNRKPLRPRTCSVCGQAVCSDCSDKYERETHRLIGRYETALNGSCHVRLEMIRVCDPCMKRVEMADYSNMRDAALVQAGVFPNTLRDDQPGLPDAASDLKTLLHDALLEAPSPQRKTAVMSLIRTVLDQENEVPPTSATRGSFSSKPVALTPLASENQHLDALEALEVETTPYDEVETADMKGRPFAVQTAQTETLAPLPYPVTDTEVQRVAEIEKVGILEGKCDELNIICDIAAKEMDAFAIAVTVITAAEQFVVATNEPALENLRLPREESFCQHTIMTDKPLIIPNPEADVRFNRIGPVTGMGIRYYCGFPITTGDDNTVIGALCCVDVNKHDITEAQFNAMQKLAQTAGKVVKIHGERRRTLSGVASSEKGRQ